MGGDQFFDKIKHGLIVSCQAHEGEPLHSAFIMGRMAIAAQEAGAVAIRANGINDINEIRKSCDLPIIGIFKCHYDDSDVYITPTKKEVLALLETGCEMIALDATRRPRPQETCIQDLVNLVHDHGIYCMADCETIEDAIHAEAIGFDCVASTLAHTDVCKESMGYDYNMVQEMVARCKVPVIAEGGITKPEIANALSKLGVHAIVVGGAITRPQQIARTYVEAIIKGYIV